jgi:hypothetical protein
MPGQNTDRASRLPWTVRDGAQMLAFAAGHAAVYGAVVWLVESSSGERNFSLIGPPAMVFAFLAWLVIVGRRSPSVLRFAATGYATVAPAAVAFLFSFGASAEITLRMSVLVLPLVLLVTGTVAAALTVAYGLALRLRGRFLRRRG